MFYIIKILTNIITLLLIFSILMEHIYDIGYIGFYLKNIKIKYTNYTNSDIILLILYKNFLSSFLALKAGILKIPGINSNPKGYTIDKP